ncbi:MAG: LutB/LldF family L-lactate oxidation iron-sulfur protein [Stellaceae bacterium]
MEALSHDFKANARRGLANPNLQTALSFVKGDFVAQRTRAVARLPEFEQLREEGRAIKDHVLAHLDRYLEIFEANVTRLGGEVHWAADAAEARAMVLEICRAAGARTVTKGKSMIAEEISLNDHLEKNGIAPIETDLGEYIIQLRHETPSHIIAPAIHLVKGQVAETFRAAHQDLDPARPLSEPRQLCDEARALLRPKFLAADVGITGANFLIAETGSSVIVTNEGNGDLTQNVTRVHIVLASIEKIVPTLEDLSTLLRLLARSASGQEFSTYTTVSSGPRRAEDTDGPAQYHVVLLDNGRSAMLGTEFQDMLRCIRCGACFNHCPVYGSIGGHAYGWVYGGPMGSVLTPQLIGLKEAGNLPNASTFCGRCEAVCPMKIPLPKMMRHWREREFERHLQPTRYRAGLKFWAFLVRRPTLYHIATDIAANLLGLMGRSRGRFRALPLAQGWTKSRDMPAPEGKTFLALWRERQGKHLA